MHLSFTLLRVRSRSDFKIRFMLGKLARRIHIRNFCFLELLEAFEKATLCTYTHENAGLVVTTFKLTIYAYVRVCRNNVAILSPKRFRVSCIVDGVFTLNPAAVQKRVHYIYCPNGYNWRFTVYQRLDVEGGSLHIRPTSLVC